MKTKSITILVDIGSGGKRAYLSETSICLRGGSHHRRSTLWDPLAVVQMEATHGLAGSTTSIQQSTPSEILPRVWTFRGSAGG